MSLPKIVEIYRDIPLVDEDAWIATLPHGARDDGLVIIAAKGDKAIHLTSFAMGIDWEMNLIRFGLIL